MAWQVAAVFCVFLSLASGDVLRYGFPEKAKGDHWAVLVAGSSGWDNYRHQADACHAYQLLVKHGFHPDRIITLMADDLARDSFNPTPGELINHPNGPDVYKGVQIDYSGKDVTPGNFLAVLKGDKAAIKGSGTGRVLKSGPNDHVFVNFVDHGAPGLLGFPDDVLYAKDLLAAINYMNKNNLYKQMVIYIEACESGSIFQGLLPENINVYATTAANADESSYACYWNRERNTYLGDVYSVKWMEDSDVEDLKIETLHKQFKLVKEETNTSHVCQFGDKTISKEDVAEFQGGMEYKRPEPQILPKAPLNPVASEDVPMSILQHKLAAADSEEERESIEAHMLWLEQVKARVDQLMSRIVRKASRGDKEKTDYLMTSRYDLKDHECYAPAVDAFHQRCMRLSQNDYALRRMYILVNLCETGIPTEDILESIHKVCSGSYRM